MERLIPAHAGKTCSQARSLGSRAAHPRSRGENLTDPSRQLQDPGSSPLTRGKRLPRYHWYQFYRLIPAHAGKTRRSAPQSGASPAHPRSRGENATQPCVSRLSAGSSPLTRGKPVPPPCTPSVDGLIPAHAGKTHSVTKGPRSSAAHPRSRGENDPPANPGLPFVGSSPLTRGKRVGLGAALPVMRLIPAHAGKTRRTWGGASGHAAHPRSRGENASDLGRRFRSCGSSPLTRGKPHHLGCNVCNPGLIPAHAGKTRPPG